MDTQKVNLAVIIKNPSNDDEFLLTKQNPPPKFNDPEYDCYQDSDLWDLPSAQLSPLDNPWSSCQVQIEDEDGSFLELLRKFDFDSAVNQVLGQVGIEKTVKVKWNFSKVVEEPEFGPGNPVKTVYIVGNLETYDGNLEDRRKWMSTKDCADLLIEVKPCNYRIGPFVVVGLLNDSMEIANLNIPPTLRFQEYPPGVKLVPMRSRTTKPFHTTNLVVFAPPTIRDGFGGDIFVASGDALIIDPGCSSTMHKEASRLSRNATLMLFSWLMKTHFAELRKDYFSTTYKFMELAPHVLIPMHGRVNMWPKHMLCGYLKNRRNRESTILKAIEDGDETLFDIVAHTYADVDRSLWIPAASNVRLHVDHLAQQNKLPKEFSMQRFQSSCKLNFFSRWIWEYLHTNLYERHHRLQIVLGAGAVTIVAILYSVRQMLSSKTNI